MKFKISFILFFILLILVIPISAKTIKGTQYTTTYSPLALENTFNYVSEEIGRDGKSTGRLVIADNIQRLTEAECNALNGKPGYSETKVMGEKEIVVDDALVKVPTLISITCSVPDDFYGIIAGDIQLQGKNVVLKKNSRNPAHYANYYSKKTYFDTYKVPNVLQIFEADSLLLKKKISRSKKRYVTISNDKKKGGKYFQFSNVVVCDTCEMQSSSYSSTLSVKGKAFLMQKNIYEKKGNTEAQRKKLKEWELVIFEDVSSLYLYRRKSYEFSTDDSIRDPFKGQAEFKFRLYPLRSGSTVNSIKISRRTERWVPLQIMITKPLQNNIQKPVYLFRGSHMRVDALPNGFYFIEMQARSSPYFRLDLGFRLNEPRAVLFSKDKNLLLALNKMPGAVDGCPVFFKDYNCLDLYGGEHYYSVKGMDVVTSPFTKKSRVSGKQTLFVSTSNILIPDPLQKDTSLILFHPKKREVIALSPDSVKLPSKWYDLKASFTARYVTDVFKASPRGFVDHVWVSCDADKKKCFIDNKELTKSLRTKDFSREIIYMTYNVAHGRGSQELKNYPTESSRNFKLICTKQNLLQQLDKIAAFVKRNNVDILALNEVDIGCNTWSYCVDTTDYLAAKLGFKYVVKGTKWEYKNEEILKAFNEKYTVIDSTFAACSDYLLKSNDNLWQLIINNEDEELRIHKVHTGNSLLSKYPITSSKIVEFKNKVSSGSSESYIDAEIHVDPYDVRIIHTHTDDKFDLGTKQLREIISKLKYRDQKIILSGDLNLNPPPRGKGLTDLFNNRFKYGPNIKQNSYISTSSQQRLDHILLRGKRISFVESKVFPVSYSDHRPLMAKISLDSFVQEESLTKPNLLV